MTEEERERKKKEKKEKDALELFFLSVLENMARAAVEAAMNGIFGDPKSEISMTDLEKLLYDEIEPAAEEALTDVFSDWL